MVVSMGYWDAAFQAGEEYETDNVVSLMNEACDEIEAKSERRVRARFAELRMVRDISTQYPSLGALARLASTMGNVEEQDALPQADINDLYTAKSYAFDVFNDAYKFRLFEMELGAVYPVKLHVDSGVAKELKGSLNRWKMDGGEEPYLQIGNDEELVDCFKMLAGARKTCSVIQRLMR